MGLKAGTVRIEEYDSKWSKIFEEEKTNLKEMFGDVAITIEHIGSTSIKGLASKPIIDIAVGVKSLTDVSRILWKFEKEPYSVKEDSVPDEILIRKGPKENRTHFIHVMEINEPRYINVILFRDYLKAHNDSLKEYEDLKKELAKKYPNDRNMYLQGKELFISKIVEKARKLQE